MKWLIKACLLFILVCVFYWRGYHYGYRSAESEAYSQGYDKGMETTVEIMEPHCDVPPGEAE